MTHRRSPLKRSAARGLASSDLSASAERVEASSARAMRDRAARHLRPEPSERAYAPAADPAVPATGTAPTADATRRD